MSFWHKLSKPFFVMAPMADVTDVAFRSLVAKRGKPDVMFTEFTSADGLYHTLVAGKAQGTRFSGALRSAALGITPEDRVPIALDNPLLRDFAFEEDQRPIVAQIFSAKPEMIEYATKLVASLGFDGVDLNMGCPDRSIERQGCGAALIKNPKLAVELIRTAQRASGLPVSVKTRIGYTTEVLNEWLEALLSADPAAITLHLRTRKEMSAVPADWELMKKAVAIRDRVNPNVLLIGNGDVCDLDDAKAKVKETGCDGVMLGRAIFGNPWVFTNRQQETINLQEKLNALIELAYGFEKLSPPKNFAILKKHVKAFVTGFSGAAELRAKLMEATNATELEALIHRSKGES